jgi:hypothetical protein
MPKLLKKILFSFLTSLVVLLSFTPFISAAKAQTNWYDQTPSEWYLKVYDSTNPNEIFGERYTAAQVQWVFYSVPSMFINWITDGNTDLGGCLMGVIGASLDVSLCDKGITTAINKIKTEFHLAGNFTQPPSIASQIFADRPISGISYVRNIINKLNPVTSVHAASTQTGFGYDILVAVKVFWIAMRNIAFFLFVIVAIVFAFMIMFRVKLSPQVVISVQSALPKIIIALILATFSYAIAGFMIDLIYIIMGLFSTLAATSLVNIPFIGSFSANIVFGFINGTLPFLKDSGINILIYFIIYLALYAITLILIMIDAVASLSISSSIFSLVLLIFFVLLILILIWYLFKTVYVLFKTLAQVYGLIIIAPIQITAGALFPQMGFGSWFKKLLAKLLIFPLTGIFIFISYILLAESMLSAINGIVVNNFVFGNPGTVQGWLTALANLLSAVGIPVVASTSVNDLGKFFAGNWGPPMLGNPATATPIAFLLMSVGVIMMIPKIGESIDSFLAGKGFAGTAIGEALGPIGGAAGGYAYGQLSRGRTPAPFGAIDKALRDRYPSYDAYRQDVAGGGDRAGLLRRVAHGNLRDSDKEAISGSVKNLTHS